MLIATHTLRETLRPGGAEHFVCDVSCRLMRNVHGLESMHINGWLSSDSARREVSILGIANPGASMVGREHDIAREHLSRACLALADPVEA